MERKYTMPKTRAAALISRVHEENLPIEVHEGNEQIDCYGSRYVDVLLVHNDPDMVNDLLADILGDEDELPFY